MKFILCMFADTHIGWCTYYTCLKRLSTFYTVIATGTDYHIWMTGSLPGAIRLHLLNSNSNDSILVHIWYKNPQRKDIYKVHALLMLYGNTVALLL